MTHDGPRPARCFSRPSAMKRLRAMAFPGPNASPATVRRGACCALVATVMTLGACGGDRGAPAAAPVIAPAWEPIAFGASDADLVGAIDLAAVRADPLFGPLVAK